MNTNLSPVFSFLIDLVEPESICLSSDLLRELPVPQARTICSGSYIEAALAIEIVDVVVPAGTSTMAHLYMEKVFAVTPLLCAATCHRRPVIVPGKVAESYRVTSTLAATRAAIPTLTIFLSMGRLLLLATVPVFVLALFIKLVKD